MLLKPALDVVDVELNIPSTCCFRTWERDAEEGDGAHGPPTSPMSPPSSLCLGWGKPSPAPLYAPSQVVFSFLTFSLSPVAKGPKPT